MPAGDSSDVPSNVRVVVYQDGCGAFCGAPEIVLTRQLDGEAVPVTIDLRHAEGGVWGPGLVSLATATPVAPLDPMTAYDVDVEADGWTAYQVSFTTGEGADEESPQLEQADVSGSGEFLPDDGFCYGDHYTYKVVDLPPGPGVIYEVSIPRGDDMEPLVGAFSVAGISLPMGASFDLSLEQAETLPDPLAPCFTVLARDLAGNTAGPVTTCPPDDPPTGDDATTNTDASANDNAPPPGSDLPAPDNGGCAAGGTPPGWVTLLLATLLGWAWRRRRGHAIAHKS